MKKTKFYPYVLLLVFATALGCRKDPIKPDVKAPTELSTKLDGVEYKIGESGLTGNSYTDAGDPVKAIEVNAALDANGRKMTFFVNDLKSGKIILDPKTGTSMMPNPGRDYMEKYAALPGFMAGSGTGVQNFVRYEYSASIYYAYSGFIEIEYDAIAGKVSMSWSVTFRDPTGREFTSSGSFTIYFSSLKINSKAAVKDPTPVSAKPVIESIAPTAGLAGTDVSIAGTNFSETIKENDVRFNGMIATVKSATATKLVVTAPTGGTTGAISIKVKNSEVATGPVFTYIQPATFTAIAPASAKVGEQITLTGTNFSATPPQNEVKFATANTGTLVSGIVKSATTTSMVVEVPVGAVSGALTVTVLGNAVTLGQGFNGLFTLATSNSTDVGKKGMVYLINATATAVDADGDIYTYDDNQQLTKRENNGTVIKTYTKNDFSTGIPTLNSYKVIAMAADPKGKVYFLMNCSTWPNGQGKIFMTSMDAKGLIQKDFETTLAPSSFTNMAVNSKGEFFILNNYFGTEGIIKMKPDGSFDSYIKGGNGGPFGGRGVYDISIGANDDMYVVAYIKGTYTTSVPTYQSIFKISGAGQISQVVNVATAGYKDGDLAQAAFNDIRSIAVDGSDIYVGDNGNFRIRKISTQTGTVSTIAGNGKQFDPNNGNKPTYDGALLNVNIYSIYSLKLDPKNKVLYGGSNQKFVLN